MTRNAASPAITPAITPAIAPAAADDAPADPDTGTAPTTPGNAPPAGPEQLPLEGLTVPVAPARYLVGLPDARTPRSPDVPLQFRLDERTRRRGLDHIATIRRQLAERAERAGRSAA
jgi:hypothetical protein